MRCALPIVLLLIGATGCADVLASHQRCEYLNERIAMCFGEDFGELACDGVSDRDLETLIGALDRSACAFVREAIPTDGDVTSATCRLFGEGCADPAIAAPTPRPTRYPIVLVNGIDASPAFRYSDRIVDTLRLGGGQDVHLATLTPYEPYRVRTPELWTRVQEILADTGAEKVNLVCHSLGGLDCRYLVSPGGLHYEVDATQTEIASRVASITTFSTAHRGTRAADVSLGLLPDYDEAEGVNAFATYLGEWFTQREIDDDVHLREAIASLSLAQTAAFNVDVPDADGIYYQSYAGVSRPFGTAPAGFDARVAEACATDGEDGLRYLAPAAGAYDFMATSLIPSSEIVSRTDDASARDVPNDGLVAVSAARWGRFRGCVPADHMEQLGQRDIPDVNVRTRFDVARFYAELAAELAAMGY